MHAPELEFLLIFNNIMGCPASCRTKNTFLKHVKKKILS